jgi:thioesterase domain-containing protein
MEGAGREHLVALCAGRSVEMAEDILESKKEEVHTTIEGIAAHYLNEMRSIQPTAPYFWGCCS